MHAYYNRWRGAIKSYNQTGTMYLCLMEWNEEKTGKVSFFIYVNNLFIAWKIFILFESKISQGHTKFNNSHAVTSCSCSFFHYFTIFLLLL